MVVGKGRSRGSGTCRYLGGVGVVVGKGRSRVDKGMQVFRPPLHTPTIRVPSFPMWFCDFDCINSTNIMQKFTYFFLCTLSALLSNAPALTSQTADLLC